MFPCTIATLKLPDCGASLMSLIRHAPNATSAIIIAVNTLRLMVCRRYAPRRKITT